MHVKKKFEKLCIYYRARLRTLATDSNNPSSAVIKDNWQERFPYNPNFTFFKIMTKHFFETSQIQINKIVVSDIPSSKLQNPIIDYKYVFILLKN